MPLSIGARLGHYTVTAKLGEGGMGEVWEATDTTLNRQVALKILPEPFATDPDRLARFQREAQVLASLNHPNIAAIHGIEEQDDTRALVLELVEGPTLADRISQGPIPVDEALPIAKQIAEALEAAHEAGIIHRDLKPANIKVREDGTVKVLDFGLAKALDTTPEGDPSQSPTLTAAATQMGVIMGTAAYMSPEQAKGKTVDKRADVWAFGCVVYEMLTGQRTFDGEDVSDVLAGVIRSEPQWDALPAEISPAVDTYLRRCLEKDPSARLRDIGDINLAMAGAFDLVAPTESENLGSESSAQALRPWQRPLPAAAIAITLVAVTGLAVWMARPSVPRPVSRFTIEAPALALGGLTLPLALSPDGRTLVYVSTQDGMRKLYRRRLDQLDANPIRGTEGATDPVFSPDGEWVAFWTVPPERALKKVSLSGGPPSTLANVTGYRWADWGPDGRIVFSGLGDYAGVWVVDDAGGAPEQVAAIEEEEPVRYVAPRFIGDGRAMAFTRQRLSGETQVVVRSFATGEERVLVDGSSARFISTGHLLFTREDSLWAVPFDEDSLELKGDPSPVLEGLQTNSASIGRFSVGENGTLAYVSTDASSVAGTVRLVRVDREGLATPVVDEFGLYAFPRFSPDGAQLAVAVGVDGLFLGPSDIWLYEVDGGRRTRLTFEANPMLRFFPTWTPDGGRLVYASAPEGPPDLYWTRTDGTGQGEPLLTEGDGPLFPFSFSPDGSTLAYYHQHPETGRDIWMLPMEGDQAPEPFLVTPFEERTPSFSPNGRWLAYVSNETGEVEVFITPYPEANRKIPVSTGGGTEPVWSPDGRELFYRTEDALWTVSINPETGMVGAPEVLFEDTYVRDESDGAVSANYDVSPDGEHFVMVERFSSYATEQSINVVLNWTQELLERVPVN